VSTVFQIYVVFHLRQNSLKPTMLMREHITIFCIFTLFQTMLNYISIDIYTHAKRHERFLIHTHSQQNM